MKHLPEAALPDPLMVMGPTRLSTARHETAPSVAVQSFMSLSLLSFSPEVLAGDYVATSAPSGGLLPTKRWYQRG